MCFWTSPDKEKDVEKRTLGENWIMWWLEPHPHPHSHNHILQLWLRYARTMCEKCVQMKLSREYHETQPNGEKEVQETWNKMRASSEEFREESRNIPRTWIRVQACRKKINITSGCQHHPDIQKELGWESTESCVETSAGEVACISKENWDELQESERETPWSRRETGWSCLHSQRELRWVPGDLQIVTNWIWGEENLKFIESLFFDSLLSANSDRMILEWWRRVGAVVGLLLEDCINSVREKPMSCPSTVFKERQCIEVVPVYYGEHSRRAKSDVTELWLADDLVSLVC